MNSSAQSWTRFTVLLCRPDPRPFITTTVTHAKANSSLSSLLFPPPSLPVKKRKNGRQAAGRKRWAGTILSTSQPPRREKSPSSRRSSIPSTRYAPSLDLIHLGFEWPRIKPHAFRSPFPSLHLMDFLAGFRDLEAFLWLMSCKEPIWSWNYSFLPLWSAAWFRKIVRWEKVF